MSDFAQILVLIAVPAAILLAIRALNVRWDRAAAQAQRMSSTTHST